MRTYKLIWILALLGILQYGKVRCASDPDLYLDEEGEEGSGDPESLLPDYFSSPSNRNKNQYPPDEEVGDTEGEVAEEEGSGMRPESKGGGGSAEGTGGASPPIDEEGDEYDDYYYYDYGAPDEEGSAFHPGYEDDLTIDEEDLDFGIVPELPKPEVNEEISVNVGPSFENSPERMPSSPPPPTLTDNHHDMENNNIRILTQKDDERQVSIFAQPGILAAFIGGAVMGLLCAILLVMFIVYRMRKRDEGSYPLDEPKRVPLTSSYSPNDKEIYA